MAERRFYWLKLKEDFFESKRIKKLRRLAGGDTLTIIYLKMQLKSIKTDGMLTYTGLEKTFAEELALDLDESPEDVGLLLNYLSATGLIETSDNINFLLPWAVMNTGSECASAERMRNLRTRQASQCDEDVTQPLRIGDGEKEKDKEIEKDKEKESNPPKAKRFVPPTLEDICAYCRDRDNGVDPEQWLAYYESNGWRVGRNPMKDWKAAVRTWERRDKKETERPLTKLEKAWGNRDDNGRIQ